jgi:hypothetical protein
MNRRWLTPFFAWLIWTLAVAGCLRAGAGEAPPGVKIDLQQELLKQQQIKATTSRVGTQLETVIAEFDRNGISGEDVKVLRAIRGVLDKLSEKDMAKVLEYLRQSGQAAEPAQAAQTATEAYAGQKSIIVQLQQLVLEYQRQQALYEISLRLKELASRQTANMWLGVSLAKSTESKNGFSSFDENQKISLRYQQSEQNPLRDEVVAILGRLERLTKEVTDGPSADRPKAALQQARSGGLMGALDSATDELKEDKLKLFSAIGNEQIARDQLREIARLLLLSQDMLDVLKQAILELERAIDAQKKVMADTEKVRKKDDADRRATEQAVVVDDTELIRRDIDSLAPIAAEHLRSATDRMQAARADLSSADEPKKRAEQAVPRQEDAMLRMQAAKQALLEQLARAEEVREKPENALAALKDLQKQVRELIQQQEQHKKDTAATDRLQLPAQAPKQGELKDKAQELQARSAAPSPTAAQSLGEAASQMQKSQNSLARQQNNEAAQQAALEALERAEQQLAQDLAKLEQAEKDLALLEELLKRLVALIEEQQKAQLETGHQAVRPDPDLPVLQALAARQLALATNTAALSLEAAPIVPTAVSPLAEATNAMLRAKAELDKPAAGPAQPPQTEALKALYLARKEFENKLNELKDMLGQPSAESPDNLAEAQRRVEEAQKEVNRALQELQQAPAGLMEALQKQQQEIADAVHEARQDSAQPQSLAPAEQAAGQAARQIGQSDLASAIAAMKAAQQALAQSANENSQPQPKRSASPAQLAQRQADVQKAAEALLSAQQKAPATRATGTAPAARTARVRRERAAPLSRACPAATEPRSNNPRPKNTPRNTGRSSSNTSGTCPIRAEKSKSLRFT